jgi:hypothetical protein
MAKSQNRIGRSSLALNLESLEQRQMLAGDVEAFAIGTVLHVRGDAQDNGIVLRSSSEGVIEVSGFSRDGEATTVNNFSQQPFTKIKEIVVTMNDGNDAVVISDLNLSGSISVQMGKGEDVLALGDFDNSGEIVNSSVDNLLGSTNIGNSIIADMGDGNDTIVGRGTTAKVITLFTGPGSHFIDFGHDPDNEIPGISATKAMTINASSGEGSMVFEGLAVQSLSVTSGNGPDQIAMRNSTIAKGIKINANDGTNTLTIEDNVIAKSLSLSAGMGNDHYSLSDLEISGKVSISDNFGDDTATLQDITAKSVAIGMGKGIDTINLLDIALAGGLNLDSGDGDDIISLINIIAKSLSVNLGAGNDELTAENVAIVKDAKASAGAGDDAVSLDRLSATSLTVTLGDGNDELGIELSVMTKKTTLDGGKGENAFIDAANNTFGKQKIKNFPIL